MKRILLNSSKYLCVIVILLGIFLFNSQVQKTPLLADDNTEFAKAVVVSVESNNYDIDETTGVGDSQNVTLEITSGNYKGQTVKAVSMNGYLYGAVCQAGTKVIVRISDFNDQLSASVYNYDREFEIVFLILAFLFTMWFVGGRKGIDSIIALVFTFIVILFMYIPMLYIGVSPFLSAVAAVILITIITHILLADLQIKSISAMLGTICGVVVAGIIAVIFGHFAHINGYNVDEIETLIYVGQVSNIDIDGILFSGILISSLGAVMDVAMSISSSLHEIQCNAPHITRKELFHSGMTIGRDMIGTMSNTLILAYVGSSINLVVILYAYNYSVHQILSMYSIAIEIMSGIAGTMGIILTVPFTSFICALLLKRKEEISNQ